MTRDSDAPGYTRTELVWAGKRTQVDRVALPFQCVETVNAPRGADLFTALQSEALAASSLPARGGTAAHEVDGRERSWRNKLIWGDNKLVMASLLKGDPAAGIESLAGTIDLIYIDPP